jgi:ketosteroid isomerase-like protein
MGMANPNLELVHQALAAYQAGDLERLRKLMDPEIEVVGGNGLINAGTYQGFDGFLDWIRRWEEAWDPVNYELREITEVTDSLLIVTVHTMGRGAASGLPIDSLFGWLYELRDGRAIRFHVYVTVDEALQVANRLVEATR